MENIFEKYVLRKIENGKVTLSKDAYLLADEAFELFKSLYNTNYGSIEEDGNLIEIHTGGWSENEDLIEQFKETYWWKRNFRIKTTGGRYYFDTNVYSQNQWEITKSCSVLNNNNTSTNNIHITI